MNVHPPCRTRQHASDPDTLIFKRVPLTKLNVGAVLSYAVYSEDDVKLIGAGVLIDEYMLHWLKRRGIESVMVEQSDLEKLKLTVNRPRGLRCRKCNTLLPLKLARSEEPSVTWACVKCEAKYHGHLNLDASQELVENVRIVKFRFNWARLQQPAETVAREVDRVVPTAYTGPERRASPRMAISIPVAALPLDEHYNPVGAAMVLTTLNISTGGIALIYHEPIQPRFLVIEFPAKGNGSPVQLVVKVLRCRLMGSVYEIAGKFVMKAAD